MTATKRDVTVGPGGYSDLSTASGTLFTFQNKSAGIVNILASTGSTPSIDDEGSLAIAPFGLVIGTFAEVFPGIPGADHLHGMGEYPDSMVTMHHD